jgi:predicted nucleic acid-binding protein
VGVILDTCIWVAIASDTLARDRVIAQAGDDPVFTSVISLGELSFGVQSCADPAERARRAAVLRQIELRPTLDVTAQTSSAFGLLCASVKSAGRSPRPRMNDLWIAAQAIENGYSLMTLNKRDFADLPGLQVVVP